MLMKFYLEPIFLFIRSIELLVQEKPCCMVQILTMNLRNFAYKCYLATSKDVSISIHYFAVEP